MPRRPYRTRPASGGGAAQETAASTGTRRTVPTARRAGPGRESEAAVPTQQAEALQSEIQREQQHIEGAAAKRLRKEGQSPGAHFQLPAEAKQAAALLQEEHLEKTRWAVTVVVVVVVVMVAVVVVMVAVMVLAVVMVMFEQMPRTAVCQARP